METELPEKYKIRLQWLQEKYRYRTDVCAKHHFRLYINCSPQKGCRKTTEFMESSHICPLNPRFMLVNFSIKSNLSEKDALHANAIIVDHYRREYERFEPRGSLPEPRESIINDVLDKEFRETFSLHGYKYIDPASFCPIVERLKGKKTINLPYGPQSFATKDDKGGTCIFWSLYYIEQRMLYPERSREDFIRDMIGKSPQELEKIIRNFVVKIHYVGYPMKESLYKNILGI